MTNFTRSRRSDRERIGAERVFRKAATDAKVSGTGEGGIINMRRDSNAPRDVVSIRWRGFVSRIRRTREHVGEIHAELRIDHCPIKYLSRFSEGKRIAFAFNVSCVKCQESVPGINRRPLSVKRFHCQISRDTPCVRGVYRGCTRCV